MLADRERHALREIEKGLRSSDPAFAATLSRHRFGEAWRWQMLLILADVTAALMLVVGVLTRSAPMVLWGTLSASALVVIHLLRTTPSTSDTPE